MIIGFFVFTLVFIFSLKPESAEAKNSTDIDICKSFFSSLFEITTIDKRPVYCDSAERYKDWVMFQGYNYARNQTRGIFTQVSPEYWIVLINDPNASLDIWLYSKNNIELISYGFNIDNKDIPIYENDVVSNALLKAIAGAKKIVLGYRFNRYIVSHQGSGAAVRYLIQTEPGNQTRRIDKYYSPR